jgi:Cd2+/Zn2+-exporting ATPase
MALTTVARFQVANLDCANCAAKIEKGLRQVEGVEEALLDFASATLSVKARDIEKVIQAVRRIDPGVDLRPAQTGAAAAPTQEEIFRPAREIALIAVSLALFFLHFVLEAQRGETGRGPEDLFALAAYLLSGWNVFRGALLTVRRGDLFDENVLMVIATVGAIFINALSEAVGVMLFYKVGELLQSLAVSRSRRSIKALLAVRPDRANVQTPFGIESLAPEVVSVGSTILVKPGEKIPLDGTILTGTSLIDTAALTGESTPVAAKPDDGVRAGTINVSGALAIRVTKPFGESSIVKILDLVQNAAARKANTEKFITTFARYYTPGVVLLAAAIAAAPPLIVEGASFGTWIYRALVLLVISCPCALMVSIPLGYFGGIGRASKRGILVKGSNFIDALARVKTVVFDKTGTLTQGVFEVEKVVSVNGYHEDQVLAFAAAVEVHSTHPIARSILHHYKERGGDIDPAEVLNHSALAGSGVRALWQGHDILVGNDALLHRERIAHENCSIDGTVAHVVVDGVYAGYLMIGDRIKPEASKAIAELRAMGINDIAMLTGDNACTAERVARRLKLDQYHADLLPEDKVQRLEQIIANGRNSGKVAVVGDGINDAPVLARADVGVAMGSGGADAAIETADVVLMTDSPAKLAEAIAVARKTRVIVWQNIALVLVVKAIFVVFGAFGLASMWEAVFADMGTAVVAVLNATRALGKRRGGAVADAPDRFGYSLL